MKKVINLLKNRIDDLDYYKSTSFKKDDKIIEKEIADLNKAIKILENSERQTSTEVNELHDSKALHIADVSKQRELLIAFAKTITYSVYESLGYGNEESIVDNFLKSNFYSC